MGVMMGRIVEVNGREVQLVLQALDEEDLIKQVDAINEMERKAKAFDEILNLPDTYGYAEEYVEDIDIIINEYMEDE